MNIAIVSYSLSGNNAALAARTAQKLGARHIALQPPKPLTIPAIVVQVLFNLTPKAQPAAETLSAFDAVVLAGPVWMGMVATPLRACLRWLRKNTKPYGYLTICGGADGPNPRIEAELRRATGRKPDVLLVQHIRTLLPDEPKPTREDTSPYRLTDADVEKLATAAADAVRVGLA
ncbi:MAG: hypothetical protein GX418_07530 [Clostridiales bacterium]|nr:hypothetical protein [Clostridiales bacterium]